MARYVHFEHYVDDPQAAVAFYQKVFGWTGQQWGEAPYWMITAGGDDEPGINGGISGSPAPEGQRVVNTIGVDDVDDAVQRAQDAGAGLALPKQAIPGAGWVAYLVDPTGIVFGVFAEDQKAQ